METFEPEVLGSILSQKDELFLTLTRTCNERCIFCIDLPFHNGLMLDAKLICDKISEGLREGKKGLLLSGGEPTIHPDFIHFVQFGKSIGYENITVITNGRKLSDKDFCERSIRAGLNEIIFAVHGTTPDVHDALVDRKGAFEETMMGLKNAKDTGACALQAQTIVNKLNYKTLPEMSEMLSPLGVRKLTFINVMPTEESVREYKDILFYNVEDALPYLKQAVERAKKNAMTVSMKKFPLWMYDALGELLDFPAHFVEEVLNKDRKTNVFTDFLHHGGELSCYGETCRYCFLKDFCDFLKTFRENMETASFDSIEFDLLQKRDRVEERFADLCQQNKRMKILLKTDSRKTALAYIRRLRFHDRYITIMLKKENFTLLKPENRNGENSANRTPPSGELHAAVHSDTAGWFLKNRSLFLKNGGVVLSFPDGGAGVSMSDFFDALEVRRVKTLSVPPCVHPAVQTVYPEAVLRYDMMDSDGLPSLEGLARYFYSERYFSKGARCQSCAVEKQCLGFPLSVLKSYGFTLLRPLKEEP